MRAIIPGVLASLIASGCGAAAMQAAPAPATLVVHADATALTRPGYAAGASIGFEATGCCEVGTYATYSKLVDDGKLEVRTKEGEDKIVDRIIDGGIELGAVAPWFHDRLRLRIRAGMAGTAPTSISLGRRGFAGSLALLFRLSSVTPPAVGQAASELDLALGYAVWVLESERDSAGEDDSSPSGGAVMLGLRIGAGYGIDLR